MSNSIFVIGTGPSGYGATRRLIELGHTPVILEKNDFIGGHCASFEFEEGFVFDDGPHISFTKNERVKELFNKNADNDINDFMPYVNNYWHGHWIKHPAITNLFGLCPDMNTKIVTEIVKNQAIPEDQVNIANYADWLNHCYGPTFTREFTDLYTRKFHTVDPFQLTTDWLGPRLYQADLEEVIYGMLTAQTADNHYVQDSRYPNKNGFVNFLSEMNQLGQISFGAEVTDISVLNKTITVNRDKTESYEHIISSMPLNVIVQRISDAPREIKEAGAKLACTQAVIVNLGINRSDLSKAHWTYIYDEDVLATRLSFPYKFSPKTTPQGCSSVQAELYYSDKYKPFDSSVDECVNQTVTDLVRMGLLESADEVIFKRGWVSPHAQIIYDHERKDSVELIHSFLRENNIEFCGRFGEWGYSWSDESFVSGEQAAERSVKHV